MLVLLSACAPADPEPLVPAQRPPNIVFILADDLGYGEVGVYGQAAIHTPRLDRMAREGMKFTQHYSGAPVCAPARSVLMTGQHSGHTTVRGNFAQAASGAGQRVPLRADDVTVAEVLRSAGYTTGIIGKWGLGEPGTTGVPNRQGFDYFFGYLNQRHAHSYFPEYLWRNQDSVPLPGNRGGGRGQYSHDLMTQEALDFLGRNRDGPFFLYLAYTLPHDALELPAGDTILAQYARRFPENEATFAAMVTRLDRDVGRVLDRLQELGLAQNTLVIFSSDNGPHSAGRDAHFFDGNGPFRGIKRDLYEGGIRVPTLAWWPGRIRAESTTDHSSAFWDFMPTAAELAGVAAPAGTDGISYLPTLLGREQPRHSHLYWEFYEGVPTQAVRMGQWKAIRRPAFTGELELYRLDEDPGERNDVAAANPRVVARIREIMANEHVPSPHWGPRPAEARE